MNYRNIDLKVDQFVGYVNEDKINLIPPFQRGHVWNRKTRRKLIENIVAGRPIPAIFLYREASGARYDYNILDGKQRLESLILFIGNLRSDLKINDIHRYFFDKKLRDLANFKIEMSGKEQGLRDLDDALFRDFREYVIPTIEITLSEENPSALDEMISLFVDINSYGEQVKRFDIVKAMAKDALLKSAFALIALTEKRGKDVFYKAKKNDVTRVLRKLQVVENLRDANSQVDRMWELTVEIVMFLRTKTHRNPIEILKSFIRARVDETHGQPRISNAEGGELRRVFRFIRAAYGDKKLSDTRLATNQIHFYTMVTSIIAENLTARYSENELTRKLAAFGQILDEKHPTPRSLQRFMRDYRELSARQSTHVGRRAARQEMFLKIIDAL
jgi:uncharacterized protein DUF262